MAYDLTPSVSPCLDRHLVFPLLEFLQDRQIYPENEILKAKIELLGKTNMVDYAMDIHRSLYHTEDVPQTMVERRAEVVGRLKSLEEGAASLITFLQNPQLVQELRQDKQFNLHMLQDKYNIGTEQIEALYQYAKFQFECGNYSGAADFLYQYRLLATNSERIFSALWGKLAAEILMQNWDVAVEELNRLKEAIESKSMLSITAVQLLQQRTWLMHWSLFIFFNTESNGRSNLIDLFFQDKYLNAIQTTSQHLLRYLTAAVLTLKQRRRSLLKDLLRVLQQERYIYTDPVTEFTIALFVDYDFEEAQKQLALCEEVLTDDFFLGKQQVQENGYASMPFRDDFMENARLCVFESFCRIHQSIHISMLADKLSMTQDAAEIWILNLIRNAKLEAKIDSEAGTVVMTTQHGSVYETIIERTRALSTRSYSLANSVATLAAGAAR
eukprot:TRINITY_DN930_c0_g1_i1.p1 TRINITY_DN930_c0_g1~~TRINITY_DN930_c0_g1_i1.p1  ORF type:complete len:458 (-),score=150.82 TRINITY_DN930_c0_g1_i1:108-1430(-)